MKKIVLIICILLLVKPVLPVIEYAINYKYISTVLCVNKAKPEMKCNGKCHLMKELAKAAEKENPLSDKKTTNRDLESLYFIPNNNFHLQAVYSPIKATNNFAYSELYQYLKGNTSFHPPSFIS